MKKRGQITIFIIVAILIVAAVSGYLIFKKDIFKEKLPANIQSVETSFLSCLEESVFAGIDALESNAGYIKLPAFEPGSDFMPFSSQLDFFGNQIPYWYYVSGNNIEREQIPTVQDMENQLEIFIEERINRCSFEDFYTAGYEIIQGEPEAEVEINNNEIFVDLSMDLDISYGEGNTRISNHDISVKSNLGRLYFSAVKVYNAQQENLFLEKYTLDIVRSYLPVDGFEISCSPLHWNADELFENLSEAIDSNIPALGNQRDSGNYFFVDLPVQEEVRFMTSKSWIKNYEVLPSDENLLVASPIGIQPDLGVLGFCYVPYHFVYNVKYPVMVQLSDGQETFQFPLAVIVQGNNPRESLDAEASGFESTGICENKNTQASIKVYDLDSNPLDADVFYECFGESCSIGKTSFDGSLQENLPQCVNGFVVAKKDGFKESRMLFSSVDGGELKIYMEKVYPVSLDLKANGASYPGEAIITFTSDDTVKNIFYPEQNSVELSEGLYEINVRAYDDSEIELGDITREQCIEVPVGIFGITREKCFEVEIPSQIISKSLIGGGNAEYFVQESQLKSSRIIEINLPVFSEPENINELQDNHALLEVSKLEVGFR